MTLRVCLDCTTGFAVGVPRCPHCGSERHAEEGSAAALGLHARGRIEEDTMPKITRHGGPSDKALREHARNLVEPDFSESLACLKAEGGELPSAGTSTATSSEKPPTTPEKNETAPPKRARSAGSRSRQGRKAAGSGTAGSTATSGPETDAADA